MDIAKIEERIDKVAASGIEISSSIGGVRFSSVIDLMEVAKLLSISKEAVPQHLRGEPGMCFAICMQSVEWKFSPFAVANKSYVVNGRLAYESQLVHAVIEQRAPIKGRLRHRFEGEGDERICIVWATPKGEDEPLEYRSPPFGKITPKNSPLWKSKPDVQLYYNASRDWARIYFPDVLIGVYAEDELRDAETGPAFARDVTPKPDISTRLAKKPKSDGFHPENIDRALEHKPGETLPQAKEKAPEPVLASQEAVQAPPAEQRTPEPPAEEPPPEAASEATDGQKPPSKAFADASTTVEAYGKQLEQGEITDLDEFKKLCRIAIDNFEGITDDERDILRGRFSGYLLAAQKKQAGRAKRK